MIVISLMRRPHVSIAEDVGGWAALMDMMSILGNHRNTLAKPLLSQTMMKERTRRSFLIIF